ncbi:MAG: bifunctional ADP-dependent NAD(P)H-hydrate dehydratase/NAD(P)H-hydrate epimerase, partial [Candidatus Aenigmarchaeota archaeon]|nr:bifunctional ADP-dependent NAD(P)H-hydrate dehydratase/NAD(P)H-hydrate epimerase [Candidatus Aenigmarchaeota archaeon]
TGNPYMTVGGTGDILAGICGSLLAQGTSPLDAACAAAYINGRAGDLAAKTKKQSLMASDILAYIEKVI